MDGPGFLTVVDRLVFCHCHPASNVGNGVGYGNLNHKLKLTVAKVRTAAPGRHQDGNGLMPSRSRQWIQRLVVHGKRVDVGLGGFPIVSLAEARDKAFANRPGRRRSPGAENHRADLYR